MHASMLSRSRITLVLSHLIVFRAANLWLEHLAPVDCGYHVGQIILIARILAGDDWETITIPRGKSAEYNEQVWGKGHYER